MSKLTVMILGAALALPLASVEGSPYVAQVAQTETNKTTVSAATPSLAYWRCGRYGRCWRTGAPAGWCARHPYRCR